jgi:3-methyladenine DNA glycosylase AlkD
MKLWGQDNRETRIMACMIDNPKAVFREQMKSWAGGFDYWEICD